MAGAASTPPSSILDVAIHGRQVVTTLQIFALSHMSFVDDISDIVHGLHWIVATLEELQNLITFNQDNRNTALYNDNGILEIKVKAARCESLFNLLPILMKKAGESYKNNKKPADYTTKRRFKSSKLSNLNMDWLDPHITRCVLQLDWLSVSLMLDLQLGNFAKFQLREARHEPGGFDEEFSLRYMLVNVRKAKLYKTEKLVRRIKFDAPNDVAVKDEHGLLTHSNSSFSGNVTVAESKTDLCDGLLPESQVEIWSDSIQKTSLKLDDLKSMTEEAKNEPSVFDIADANHGKSFQCPGYDSKDSIGPEPTLSPDKSLHEEQVLVDIVPKVVKSIATWDNKSSEVPSGVSHHASTKPRTSWLRNLFSRKSFAQDYPSPNLEAFVVSLHRQQKPQKVPLGHLQLTAWLHQVSKKQKSKVGEDFMSLTSINKETVNKSLATVRKLDTRKRDCIAVDFNRNNGPDCVTMFIAVGDAVEPVCVKDAAGRSFTVPYEDCKTWTDWTNFNRMNSCQGEFDAIDAVTGRFIFPGSWDSFIHPGASINIQPWSTIHITDGNGTCQHIAPPLPNGVVLVQPPPPPQGVILHVDDWRPPRMKSFQCSDYHMGESTCLGFDISHVKELENEAQMDIGDLLSLWTNATDTIMDMSNYDNYSDSDSDTESSLADD